MTTASTLDAVSTTADRLTLDVPSMIGGGAMGQRVRETDWSATPLGAYPTWPQSLRSSLSLVLNAKGIAALYWGPEQWLLYNDAYGLALGDRHPSAFGRPMPEVLTDIAPVLGPQVATVLRTGEGFAIENLSMVMHRHGRDEETVWTYSFSPVQGETGGFAGVLLLATEMTGQKKLEKALLAAEAQLRKQNVILEQRAETSARERDQVWEHSKDLLGVADDRGVWLSISPAWTRTLGWQSEDIIGRTSEWMEHPDDRSKTRAEVDSLAAGRTTFEFENRFRTKVGDYRILTWTAVPEAGQLYCVARDITAERAQANSLALVEEALRQSQKMEAVGQLTGGLAHDFNNLLTGISGSLDLLQKRVAQGRFNDLDRYVVAAQGASKRAAALTHRLLAFSRRQTLDPKPTDVSKLIKSMADLVRRTVGPEITVEIVDMIGLWTALVDPNQLENALLNLAINARDAMPDGGRITVETGNKWMDDRAAKERDMSPGQYLSICLSDTGTGMPPEVIARAFDPFYTTKPIGMGTGLGLSMIYGFARQSGGMVRIYSEVGQGTMVCMYLPRHYGEEEAVAAHDCGEVRGAEVGETVLVVDDDATVRMLVTDVLSDLGYGALEAEDGAAGLRILRSGVRVDLLVTDVGLPNGMNGRQVADAAREIRPGLKVLFITGYAQNAVVGNGHLDPGMAVMTKPFAMDDLAVKIRSIIEG